MSKFQVLGIKTGGSPTENEISEGRVNFLKILKPDTYFPFYSSFEYDKDQDLFTLDKSTNIDLYSFTRQVKDKEELLHISISAVVGKNGTGKSSLMELYFAMIYVLSTKLDIIKPNLKSLKIEEDKIEGDKTSAATTRKAEIYRKKTEIRNLYKSISGSLCYYRDDRIYVFKFIPTDNDDPIIKCSTYRPINGKYTHFATRNVENDAILKGFFYSISDNYSLYGLNSNTLGDWINTLFHKNDGYRTPLVINPMRTEGNIDINDEHHLIKSRLFANIIEQRIDELLNEKKHKSIMINGHKFSHLLINLKQVVPYNYGSILRSLSGDQWVHPDKEKVNKIDSFADDLFSVYPELKDIKNGPIKSLLIEYCYSKLRKVLRTKNYWHYHGYPAKKTIELFRDHPSHVTTKFNQALNELRFTNYSVYEESFNKAIIDVTEEKEGQYYIDVQEFENNIDKQKLLDGHLRDKARFFIERKLAGDHVIDFLLSPIWNIDFCFDDNNDHTLDKLSSGENQLIHSVQSIIYHLRNISSVPEGLNIVKYPYANIILDEVELYFHPEYQRVFIHHLLDSLKSADISEIKGINIQFITHSPFILSDIPKECVLFMDINNGEEGKYSVPAKPDEAIQTFGANIHDLLRDSFFLKSTTGEFAREQILTVVNFYNLVKNKNLKSKQDLREEYSLRRDRLQYIVSSIGEDTIRGILENHLREIENHLLSNEELLAKKKRLKEELDQIDGKLNTGDDEED